MNKALVCIAIITSLTTTVLAQDATKHFAQNVSTAEFLTKIFNYRENPQAWNYLGDKPCLIDFWAPWCGPCRMLGPTTEELAKEYDGQIYIYKLDTQAEPEVASVFGIKSIPSLLFIPLKGQPQMAQGALPKDVLKQIIDTVLLGKPAQQPTENRVDNKLKE